MEERCRQLLSTRAYKNYSAEMLEVAVDLVSRNQISSLEAEKQFFIPRRTIENKIKNKHNKQPGGQLKLSESEEQNIVDVLIAAGDFGSPLSRFDLSMVVFNYLKNNEREYIFKNKPPGRWWIKNFLKRHKDQLTTRAAQNIKKVRAAKTTEEFQLYFENLQNSVHGIPKSNILNYDETNLSDNPGSSKCIFKRSVKYPERVLDHTKGNISIMFAAAADGTLLPTYTVYKSENLWKTWCENGPSDARYNRTKSGWFDATVFEDWFQKVVLPWAEKLEGPKLVIGDNLSSHLNVNIVRLCEEKNIRFTFLPPNSTHISQPLDVAFFGPLKKKWRQILTTYKYENPTETQLNKAHFPLLLKSLLEAIKNTSKENIISGFRATGIVPFNPQEIVKKLPDSDKKNLYSIDSALLDYLKANRSAKPIKKVFNKKINIAPGASVSSEEMEKLVKKKNGNHKGLNTKTTGKENAKQNASCHSSSTPEPEIPLSSKTEPPIILAAPGLKTTENKVTILSEVKYSPFNTAFCGLSKNLFNLTKVDASHDLFFQHTMPDMKLNSKINPNIEVVDYDNSVPSTSKQNPNMTPDSARKRKLDSEFQINRIKKRKQLLEEETDENSDDYSLRDSSDEGSFISEASLKMQDPTRDLLKEDEKIEEFNLDNFKNSDTAGHQVGSFLLVKLLGKKTKKFYVGKLIELTEGSGMLVKFMRKRKGNLFYWPEVNDIGFVVDTDVEMILTNPQEGRRGTLKFDSIDFKKYDVQ